MHYGRIKFYDNKINHFGFITNVFSPIEDITDEIYLNKEILNCSEDLLKEQVEVVFEIVEARNGKRANNVRLLSQLTFEEQVFTIKNFKNDEIKLKLLKFDINLLPFVCTNWSFQADFYTSSLLDKIKEVQFIKEELTFFINLLIDKIEIVPIENALNALSYLNDINYLSKYFSLKNITSANIYNEIEKNIKRFFVLEKEIECFECLIKHINFDDIKVDFQIKARLLKLVIEYFKVNKYKDLIPTSINNSKIASLNDFTSACELSSLADDTSSIYKLTELYKNISANFSDSDKLLILNKAEGQLIKEIIKSWNGTSDYNNDRFLKTILSNDKYLIYEDIIRTVLHEKINISIGENPLTDSLLKSDYLTSYFNYVKKFKDNYVLKKLIIENLFENQELFRSYFHFFDNPEITEIVRDILKTVDGSKLELQIKTLYFLAKTKYVPEIELLKKIISNCNPFIQYFLIKKIVSLYYQKIINENTLSQLLQLNEWTNISSLLLINFILKKPQNKKEALNIISLTFKEHLNKLKDIDDLTSFNDLFTIQGLVKSCDGRKYYNYKIWQRDLISRNYVHNKELVVSEKMSLFCEGRYWKENEFWISETNEHFKAVVYWCRGGVCYGLNNKIDFNDNFIDWTLLEISKIFNLNLDPLIFSIIGGWANRMNEISERLKCRNCNSLLKPIPFDPKQLGFYATPLFICVNKSCTNFESEIRFTHCLNGKCNKILDSRDLQKCSNGWLICECGTCCPDHSGKVFTPRFVDDDDNN